MEDLATVHHPVTDLFQVPSSEEGFNHYAISGQDVDNFKTKGYLAGVKVLDDHQIEVLKTALEEFLQPDYQPNPLFYEFHSNEASDPNLVLFHALGAWRVSPPLHDILWNPGILKPASQLLDDQPVRFWHDQLFCKPALHGGVVAWHQDYSYWTRTKPMQHLTCWIGLDDADRDNGCMYYVPESHRWGLLDKPELAGDMDGIMRYLDDEQKKQFQPIPIELKKGYATFHHPLLLHGSYANNTNRPRRAIVLNYFVDGTRSDSDEALLDGTETIKKGKKMSGKFFPLLYNP